MFVRACVCRSDDNLQEGSSLLPHRSCDQTQVVRFGGRHLHLLSCLAGRVFMRAVVDLPGGTGWR